MKNLLFIFTLLIPFYTVSQGLNLSSQDEIVQFEKYNREKFGFGIEVSSSFNLERYVPEVAEQTGSTCVGYASLYYGLSMMYNIKFNITSPREKLAHSFDPNFIYSLLQNKSNSCSDGLYMWEAIDLISNVGAKKLFFSPYLDCSSSWNQSKKITAFEYTKPYSINEFYYFKTDYPNLVNSVKEVISGKIPVIAGFNLLDSMYPFSSSNPNGVDYSGLWTPKDYEVVNGGHAMCIVGYDDYKYGGSFRVVNSWGKEYGDNGYLWIRYSDFKKYVSEAYFLELNDNTTDNNSDFQIDDGNYQRIKMNNGYVYEGQVNSDNFEGLGILSNTNENWFLVGKFRDSKINGNLIIFDDDGIFSAYGDNGNISDVERLGFGSNDNSEKTRLELTQHLKTTGLKYAVRKANSTKANSIESDYEK